MTMEACADNALAALDAAGIERALVCGLSVGGYVTFELWRRASRAVPRHGAREHPGRRRYAPEGAQGVSTWRNG